MDTNLFQITDLEVHEKMDVVSGNSYLLFRNLSENYVTVLKYDPFNFNDETFWESISEKIKTLLFNRIKFHEEWYQDKSDLLEFIDLNTPEYTPEEKLDLVLGYISNLTNYDGEAVLLDTDSEFENKQIWRRYYFANSKEFWFYINNLKSQGYISFERGMSTLMNLGLTLKGLTAILNINKLKASRFCFVAMSFNSELVTAYNDAIKPALEETGFIPYIVSQEHVGSDITINDAIIAGIKKAHFTIADFTQHKAGVYFEAGYALGRGQKVIYTCRQDDISSAHFDTRNYQHIVWETTEDLKSKLIDKINAQIIP